VPRRIGTPDEVHRFFVALTEQARLALPQNDSPKELTAQLKLGPLREL